MNFGGGKGIVEEDGLMGASGKNNQKNARKNLCNVPGVGRAALAGFAVFREEWVLGDAAAGSGGDSWTGAFDLR